MILWLLVLSSLWWLQSRTTTAFVPTCHSPSSRMRTSRLLATVSNSTTSSDIIRILPAGRLAALQKRAAPVVADYEVNDPFNPVPWLSNCHIQTIGGFLLREKRAGAYVPKNNPVSVVSTIVKALFLRNETSSSSLSLVFWDSRERIETPDGDWFHADTKYATTTTSTRSSSSSPNDVNGAPPLPPPPPPTVILVHGLESNSDSPASQEMATAFTRQGMHCVCLNFRGCSGTPNDTIGGYHLGFTDDLKHYLRLLKERGVATPTSPVYLSGFSLGANVVLKCLGELGCTAVVDYHIAGASVVCAPLDQVRNSIQLAQPGINREIYTHNLLRSLKRRATDQWERFGTRHHHHSDGTIPTTATAVPFDYQRALAAATITEFDDAFIAPIYGFDDCWDYYRQTSSISYLDQIAVPTLILNARDDPFFDPHTWPVNGHGTTELAAPLKLVRTEHGGHLGFVVHQVDPEDFERLQPLAPPSWSAAELGRFLGHVQSSHASCGPGIAPAQ